MPSTAPPVPTAKTTPCSSADQGGQGWRGQQGGKSSEKGGEERERPNAVGHLPQGCENKPRHEHCSKQGPGRAPSALPWGPSILGICPLTCTRNARLEEPRGITWLGPSSSLLPNQWHLKVPQNTLTFSKTPFSHDAEHAIPPSPDDPLRAQESFLTSTFSPSCCPFFTSALSPFAHFAWPYLDDCSPLSQASKSTPSLASLPILER